jgi:hypothetical protein
MMTAATGETANVDGSKSAIAAAGPSPRQHADQGSDEDADEAIEEG